jgi:hypothetical protein
LGAAAVSAVSALAVRHALLDCDGTVTMTAYSLPAEGATAACARVDRLAEETKRAGHRSRVGQIAADVFLGLLDGRFHGLTEDQIVAALLRDPRPEDTSAKEASSENTAANGSAAGGAPGAAGEVPVASASGAEGGDGPAEAEVDNADSEGQNGTGSGTGTAPAVAAGPAAAQWPASTATPGTVLLTRPSWTSAGLPPVSARPASRSASAWPRCWASTSDRPR